MAGDVIIYHIDGRLASTVNNGPPIPQVDALSKEAVYMHDREADN